MSKPTTPVHCPTCKRTVERPQGPGLPPHGPFCSARCRSADLGHWLNGNYRIANAHADEDEDGDTGAPPESPSGSTDPMN